MNKGPISPRRVIITARVKGDRHIYTSWPIVIAKMPPQTAIIDYKSMTLKWHNGKIEPWNNRNFKYSFCPKRDK